MDDTGATKPDAAHFRAFVSYSHADAAIAQKLHRKIETYKLPKHLRGEKNGVADAGGRVGRIFRDREDLPAAEDLSQSVKAALAQSRALIVLCSPDAKASRWVAQEIDLFRELHPDRPVLAAIVRGEPDEAFPEPLLQGTEPLAADMRKEGDGWRLGFLKIVAGIAEVPLDALVQRDGQRRLRSVMAVTLLSVVGLVAMIGMTIFAIQQRNEAQHQQAEAEGLVEYMLTDLRTELKGVGRLDVMTDVNERAMDFYEGQGDLSDMPAESLERRARILHAMGEDDEKRGDLDKALAKFTEAHRVTEALLARDPDNADRIFGHAQSEYWVGYIAWEKGDNDRTLKHWTNYHNLSNQLAMVEAGKARGLLEQGYSAGNLCTFYMRDNRDIRKAKQNCDQAIVRLREARALEPDNSEIAEALANRIGWLAKYFGKNGNQERALELLGFELQIMDELFQKDSKNLKYAMRRIWSLSSAGEQLSLAGRKDEAIAVLKKAELQSRELLLAEPNSIEHLGTRLRVLIRLAQIEKSLELDSWEGRADAAWSVLGIIEKIDPVERLELERRATILRRIKAEE